MDYSVKIKSKNYISHLNHIIGDNTNIHLFRIINLEDIKTIF